MNLSDDDDDDDDDVVVIFEVNKKLISSFFNAGQFFSAHFGVMFVTYAAFAPRVPDLFV